MQSSIARDNYLFAEVRTATPQKLQLLLIDAALMSANRARQFWQDGNNERATEALINAQALVSEMLAGISPDVGGELAQSVSAVYEFIFRSLVKAGARRDEKSLGDAIRILEIERETWRRLCDKIASDPPAAIRGEKFTPSPPPASVADLPSFSGGFSVEA
jgi:flagellar protein FliS